MRLSCGWMGIGMSHDGRGYENVGNSTNIVMSNKMRCPPSCSRRAHRCDFAPARSFISRVKVVIADSLGPKINGHSWKDAVAQAK
jgi:hypothetical protein